MIHFNYTLYLDVRNQGENSRSPIFSLFESNIMQKAHKIISIHYTYCKYKKIMFAYSVYLDKTDKTSWTYRNNIER